MFVRPNGRKADHRYEMPKTASYVWDNGRHVGSAAPVCLLLLIISITLAGQVTAQRSSAASIGADSPLEAPSGTLARIPSMSRVTGSTPGPWVVVNPIALAARYIGAGSDGTKVYAAGGYQFGGIGLNQFARLDPATGVWTSLASMPDSNFGASVVYSPINNKVFVFGGYRDDGTGALSLTRIYDVASDMWSMGVDMPDRRLSMASGYHNGKIYLVAGNDTNLFGDAKAQTWEYDPVLNSWNTTRSDIPQATFGTGYGVVNGHLYVISGSNSGPPFTSVYDYDIAADAWTTRAPIPTAVYGAGSAVVDNKIWLFGGGMPFLDAENSFDSSAVPIADTQIYDPLNDSWSTGEDLNSPRNLIGGAGTGTYAVAVGGRLDNNSDVSTTEVSSYIGPSPSPTPTPSDTNTPTSTPTNMPTSTPDNTSTITVTPVPPTFTSTITPTHTPVPVTPSATPTRTPTSTPACGLHWRPVSSPNPGTSQNRLYGVSILSSTDVWAVGYQDIPGNGRRPLVMRWDGSNWNVMATPPASVILRGVTTLSANNVWAVGHYTNSFEEPMGTLIMHWEGTTWSIIPAPSPGTTSALYSIAAANASDIWAVGSIGGGVLILHWNGTSWVVADPNSGYGYSLNGVTVLSANDVWAVGSRQSGALAMHWNGSQWSVVPVPELFEGRLYSVDAVAPNDIWAVGTYALSEGALAMHWNGSQWSVVSSPQPGNLGNILHGVTAITSNDVWAVGEYESNPPGGVKALMQHWDGSTWTTYPTLDPSALMRLRAVAHVSSADIWAVGAQYITSTYQTLVARYNDPCAVNTPVPTNTQLPTSTRVPTATPCTITFGDVPDTNTFYANIRCLACRGIISGYSDGTFRPNNEVTRGQLAKIVSNSAGFTEDPNPQIFEDVPSSNTFYEWINRLARRGHMSGYPCGGAGEPCTSGMPYFRPFANATRGQTSKIVSNAAGYTEIPTDQTFEDVPPTHTFYREIQRLATRNIMQGYPCGGVGEPCTTGMPYFRPGNNVTRGQSAKIVANTFFPGCNPSTRP